MNSPKTLTAQPFVQNKGFAIIDTNQQISQTFLLSGITTPAQQIALWHAAKYTVHDLTLWPISFY